MNIKSWGSIRVDSRSVDANIGRHLIVIRIASVVVGSDKPTFGLRIVAWLVEVGVWVLVVLWRCELRIGDRPRIARHISGIGRIGRVVLHIIVTSLIVGLHLVVVLLDEPALALPARCNPVDYYCDDGNDAHDHECCHALTAILL